MVLARRIVRVGLEPEATGVILGAVYQLLSELQGRRQRWSEASYAWKYVPTKSRSRRSDIGFGPIAFWTPIQPVSTSYPQALSRRRWSRRATRTLTSTANSGSDALVA